MVTPWLRSLGLNGLKLQFHWVPCSLEIVRVPDGPAVLAPFPPVELEGLELPLHAASAAASSAAALVRIRRLIALVLH